MKRGSSVILEAFVDSANPVTYSWFKDGKPVQLGASKSIVGQGNLKILYAQEVDAGSYRVVVQSNGESLEATAKLIVTSEFSLFCFIQIKLRDVYTASFIFLLISSKVKRKALFSLKVFTSLIY